MPSVDKSEERVYTLGVDDGHHSIKVVNERGDCWVFPSRIQYGKVLNTLDDTENFYSISSDGGDKIYTVSDYLPNPIDTRSTNYPISDFNLALVHHALRKAGYGGKKVNIATGLPVNQYFIADSEKNELLIKQKQYNLTRPISFGTEKMAEIISNFVVSEAIAAYFDSIMDFEGQPTTDPETLKESVIGVIDIGGKTTDCAVILPGADSIDAKRTGATDLGVLNLYDAINTQLKKKEDVTLPPSKLEKAISKGEVAISGRKMNIKNIIDEEASRLCEQILNAIYGHIDRAKDLDQILLIGGGAYVFEKYIRDQYPHIHVPADPEFANARGMLKVNKFIYSASKK